MVVAVGIYFVGAVLRPGREDGVPSPDLYLQFYPWMLAAVRAVHEGGRGLFWNAYQNCGQPFFGIVSTGLVYPLYLAFLIPPPHEALRVVLLFHMVIGGVGAYRLGRELGARPPAALAGALAFELGNGAVRLITWAPYVSAPYAWFPWAMLACERTLRAPSIRRGILLGVVLALVVLPGVPQMLLFIGQLIALRTLWRLVLRRVPRPAAALGAVGLGLVLGPLLAALPLVPGTENALLSIRGAPLSLDEIGVGARFFGWSAFRAATDPAPTTFAQITSTPLVWHQRMCWNPFLLVATLFASAGGLAPATRRDWLFYLGAGLVYFVLGLGPNTPLFGLYMHLPFGSFFREPIRFMWVASFCLAVATALGVEALASTRGRRLAAPLLVGGTFAAFLLVFPLQLGAVHWALGAAALAVAVVPGGRPGVAGVACLLVLADVLVLHSTTLWRLLPDDGLLFTQRAVLERVRARLTPQDRVFVIPPPRLFPADRDLALMQKTGTLFAIPTVRDYEPETSRRFAEYTVMMLRGTEMRTLNDFVYAPFGGWRRGAFARTLFDLAATRYVVASTEADDKVAILDPPLRVVDEGEGVRVWENPNALERAFYVPRVEVVEAGTVLTRLAHSSSAELRRVALLEAPPPSGLRDSGGEGTVDFVRNDPEHITLAVRATASGFVFLADQHFPGWRATVNDEPVPILRANHAFRLVEVPAGVSTVEFVYRPGSVRAGAWLSGLTLLGVVACLVLFRRADARVV